MTASTQMKRRAMLIYMLDRPGGLNKISMLIRRKMYNVETITACKTHRPGISRMTLTLREDSDDKMLQVIRQVEKMTEVISAGNWTSNRASGGRSRLSSSRPMATSLSDSAATTILKSWIARTTNCLSFRWGGPPR
jgi:hypothetical protein